MINFLKKKIQQLNEKPAQYEQLLVNAEDEYLVMSCGLLNSQLLAMIKRSKTENNQKMGCRNNENNRN